MIDNLSVYICDDEKKFALQMQDLLKQNISSKFLLELEVFTDGKSLLKKWKEKPSDVIFLDIDMPNLDGFDISEKLRENNKKPIIIFVTSHDDEVYRVWKYKPFWFLRKSHIDDLPNVLKQLYIEIDNVRKNSQDSCLLKCEDRVIQIKLNHLISIESFNHNIILEFDNQEAIKARCKIEDVENQLNSYHIIRIQRGILINFKFVSKISSRAVILMNGKNIPIGRNRLCDVKVLYQKFLREL